MDRRWEYIWMLVTTDKYELPLAVAGSAKELGEMIGEKNYQNILSAVSHAKYRKNKSKYVRVKVPYGEGDI